LHEGSVGLAGCTARKGRGRRRRRRRTMFKNSSN
jgi:hypothetical protein